MVIADKEIEDAADDVFVDEPDPEPEIEVEEATDAPDDEEDDDDEDDDEVVEEKVEVTAGATPRKVRRQVGPSAKGAEIVPARRLGPEELLARDGVAGKHAGDSFHVVG